MKKMLDKLRHRIGSLFGHQRRQEELARELRAHVAERSAELRASGLGETEAEHQARREFGSPDRFEEECRDAWGLRWWQDFRRDVTLASRRAWQQRGFSTVVVVTFALGVGLNTLMFSVFNSLWLNPGLYPEEDRVVRVYEYFSGGIDTRGQNPRGTSPLYFKERMEQSELAQDIALTMSFDHTISNPEAGLAPEFLPVLGATASLFRVLGVQPLLGRGFTEDEAEAGNDGVAVLYYDYWQSRFHGDPDVIGRRLYTDGNPREIIGVMPEHFQVPANLHLTDGSPGLDRVMIVPFGPRNWWGFLNDPHQRHFPWAGCFARLKPGVTYSQFRDELNAINARNGPLYPEQWEFEQRYHHRTEVATMNQDLIRENKTMLMLLQGAMGFVLLIGSINIVSLVLSRNSARRAEFALRLSLGASRGRLATQLMTETWLLALIGGLLGLGVAWGGLQGLAAGGAFRFFVVPPRLELDGPVVAFALVLASLVGIGAGLASSIPLLRDRRLRESLAEDGRTGSASRDAKTFRAVLLGTEIVFTAILLIGGTLLLRSFSKILQIDPGYRTENLLTSVVRLPSDRYDEDSTKQFIATFEQRLQELPGVESAGITNWPPLKVSGAWTWKLIRPGDDVENQELPICIGDAVGRHYFDALEIRLLQGRLFTAADYDENAAVAVIDRRVAETHFAGQDPIGQMVALPWHRDPLTAETPLTWLRVIGVVEPIRVNDLMGYSPLGGMIYKTYQQEVPFWVGLVIRTQGDPAALVPPVQSLLAELEPTAAVARVESMTEAIQRRYGRQQAFLFISLLVGAVAWSICTLGVYGMLAHSVACESKEIAIRRALGAPDGRVVRDVMKLWIQTAAIGLAIGLMGALLISQPLASTLYEIEPTDPVAYAAGGLALALTILASAALSARRAVSLDLVQTLRG